MVEWKVEADSAGTWEVVRVEDGRYMPVRRHLSGLSCIAARVLAEELQRAYLLGCQEGAGMAREILAREVLGD